METLNVTPPLNKLLNDVIRPTTEYSLDRKHVTDSNLEGVYMFFSFDLVNSTALKSSYPHEWRHLISEFYNTIGAIYLDVSRQYSELNEPYIFHPFVLWKYVGDEVLLYKKILCFKEIYHTIQSTYKLRLKIKEALFKSNVVASLANLDIKICIWIADCSPAPDDLATPGEHHFRNMIYYNALLETAPTTIDFLGPDIDEGFRISQLAEKDKVIVSAKLTYALWKYYQSDPHTLNIINNNFKIAYFTTLKGIWQERKYPLIIYSENFNDFYDSLAYDEFLDSPIVTQLVQHKVNHIDLTHPALLERIYENLHQTQEVLSLIALINQEDCLAKKRYALASSCSNIPSQMPLSYHSNHLKLKPLDLHITVIAYTPQHDILVLKKNRNTLSNCWDFGVVFLTAGESWSHCINSTFCKMFDISLGISTHPTPIATYTLKKHEGLIPGIVILAPIKHFTMPLQIASPYTYEYQEARLIQNLSDLGPNALMSPYVKKYFILSQKIMSTL